MKSALKFIVFISVVCFALCFWGCKARQTAVVAEPVVSVVPEAEDSVYIKATGVGRSYREMDAMMAAQSDAKRNLRRKISEELGYTDFVMGDIQQVDMRFSQSDDGIYEFHTVIQVRRDEIAEQ